MALYMLVERSAAFGLRKHKVIASLVALLAMSFALPVLTQTSPGVLPFSTQENGVDLATGNVNVSFPLRSKAGKISFWSQILGTSGVTAGTDGTNWTPLLVWQYQDPTILTVTTTVAANGSQQCSIPGNPQQHYYIEKLINFSVMDSTGANHSFNPANSATGGPAFRVGDGPSTSLCATQTTGIGTYVSTDNSGYSMSIAGGGAITITDRVGNNWTGTCTYENQCLLKQQTSDADGSTIVASSSGVTDTLGVVALANEPTYIGTPVMPSGPVTYTDASGNTQSYSFSYTSLNLASSFGCNNTAGVSSPQDYGPGQVGGMQTASLLTGLTLPDSSKYTISYEPTPGVSNAYTGRISKITLPSGGSISYAYSGGNNGINCAYGTVPTLTVTVNDNNGNSGIYTYTSNLSTAATASEQVLSGTNYQVTKTDPAGNQTVYSFNGDLQTQVISYQGSAGGTPLKTVTTCYNGNLTNCVAPSSAVILPITQQDVSTSYGAGSQALTETTYDTYGNVTTDKEIGFGNANASSQCISSTAVCRLTATTYGSWNGSTCASLAGLPGLPCDVKVTNASTGTTASETRYTYNSAGHATTVARLVSGSTFLSSTNAFNSNGTLSSTTDPNGNVTGFGYGGSSAGGCNGVLLTSIMYPVTSAGSASQTWNCAGGVRSNQTDANGQTTTYTYNDPQWRLTGTALPDGGSTTASYSFGTSSLWTQSATQAVNGSTFQTASVTYDGLGRIIKQQSSDPGGTVTADTSYDAVGNVHTLSNPHFSSSSTSDGTTTFTYDALGRRTSESDPDGNRQQWCYNGVASTGQTNCTSNSSSVGGATWTDASDQAGHHRQSVSDALGRLVAVMEPNPSSGALSLETDYTYTLSGDLSTVVQNGAPGEQARTRSFGYDLLSRLGSATNPESGTTTYTYDNNGNLLSKTDARSEGMQYTYDGLNRMASMKHVSGSSVTGVVKAYYYDGANPSESLAIPASARQLGRLSMARSWAPFGNGYHDEYQTYDRMGRVSQRTEVSQSEIGTGGHSLSIGYDLAGNINSLTYPDGRTVTSVYGSSSRLASMSDSNGAAYVSSVAYFPNGSPQLTITNNVLAQQYSMNSRQQICDSSFGNQYGTLMRRQYFFGSDNSSNALCNTASGNNGNILHVMDALNTNNSQHYVVDTLDRLTQWNGASPAGIVRTQRFGYDSFGNLAQGSGPSTPTASSYFNANNQYLSSFFNCYNLAETVPAGYDAAGNVPCTGTHNSNSLYFGYNEEGQIVLEWGEQQNNVYTLTSLYSYDSSGQRIRSDQYTAPTGQQDWTALPASAHANWREYTYFNGQLFAEKDQSGTWTDYIYANGRKLAIAKQQENVLQVAGTYSGSWTGVGQRISAPSMSNYVFRTGDVLNVRQRKYGTNVHGGILIYGNGTGSYYNDQDGQRADDDTLGAGTWHNRRIPLDGLQGTTFSGIQFGGGTSTNYTFQFATISVSSTDGSVRTIFNGDTNGPIVPVATDTNSPRFFAGDQVGTEQMEVSAAGYPLWKGEFSPFGIELDNNPTSNRLKFTGKERDAESGLDYFGARFYSGSYGRWMSPDPSMTGQILELPQSWNKYAYEYNRPLYGSDPDGLCPPCAGAIIGGVIEGVYSAGSQYISNGYSFSGAGFSGQKVIANVIGGAVSGAIAGATGGASIVAEAFIGDVAAGATGNIVGGAVTRALDPSVSSDQVASVSNVSSDALSGFVGGGVGHVAAALVHIPDPARAVKTTSGTVYQRQIAKQHAASLSRSYAIAGQTVGANIFQSAYTHLSDYLQQLFFSGARNGDPVTHEKVTVSFYYPPGAVGSEAPSADLQ